MDHRFGKPLKTSLSVCGNAAHLSEYRLSLQRFALRVTNGIPGWNITLSCDVVDTFRGPVEWSEPRLLVEPLGGQRAIIRDPRAGFEAFVEHVWIGEDQVRRRDGRDALRAYARLPSAGEMQPLLEKWRGGLGCLLQFEAFARSADIRIGRERNNLRILCFGVEYLRGRGTKWENANIEVEPRSDGLFRILDQQGGVEAIAARVHVREMAER